MDRTATGVAWTEADVAAVKRVMSCAEVVLGYDDPVKQQSKIEHLRDWVNG